MDSHIVAFKDIFHANKSTDSISSYIDKHGHNPPNETVFALPYDQITSLGYENGLSIERISTKELLYNCKRYHLGVIYVTQINPDVLMEKEIIDCFVAPPEENDIVYTTKVLEENYLA